MLNTPCGSESGDFEEQGRRRVMLIYVVLNINYDAIFCNYQVVELKFSNPNVS